MKYTIKDIQYNQLTESNPEENGNVFDEENNENPSYPLENTSDSDTESNEDIANTNENDSEENDDNAENSYSYNSTAAVNVTEADAPSINSFESRIDWNVISLSSIWIFLTLTFFGIFF